MILTSTTETVPFTPAWGLKDDGTPKDGAVVFHLRAGSVIERGQMEAEIAGVYRAGRVYGYELRQAVRAGVMALLADDPEYDRVLALIDSEAEAEAEGVAIAGDDARLLVEVKAVLAEHWPEYRDLTARLERRREIAPIVALRRYCTGWENATNDQGAAAVFSRGRDGQVSDAALAGLSSLDITVAGNRAYGLQYAGTEQRGNLPRPSSSGDGPQTSPSDAPSKAADGKSPARPGRKTRG